ncbi:hypothetical protein D3C87_299820 [compost metagenome]
MANKTENKTNKIFKFIKRTLWSLFIALLLGIALNMVFLRAVRNYTTQNLQLPLTKTHTGIADSSNRVIRFPAAMIFARRLMRTQSESPVCKAICNPSVYQIQGTDNPLIDGVNFYKNHGSEALNDFNFALGTYMMSLVGDFLPRESMDSLERSTMHNSLSADLAISVKMQFDIFGISGDMKTKLENFKTQLDNIPDLIELNMLCQAKQTSEESAKKVCADLIK